MRSEKLLSLEEAVRRMTWLPASTFRLANRGQVKAGRFADLVVFDPQKVADKATYDSPRETATGFRLVLVNGVPVVENDRHTGRGPGKALRRQ